MPRRRQIHTERLNLRISPDLLSWLTECAEQNGCSVSEAARDVLDDARQKAVRRRSRERAALESRSR